MKKLLTAVLLLTASLVLFACGGDDEEAHTHEWDNGSITTEATCKVEGEKTFTCSGCEETKIEKIAKLAHKWDEGVVTSEASCTAVGSKKFTCELCGDTKTEEIAKLAHTYDWKYTDEEHWQECECSDVTEASAHNWDEGVVTREATCSKFGYKQYTCADCGHIKLEKLDKLAHTPGTELFYDEENHWNKCHCSEKVNVAAHVWDEGVVTTAPSCSAEGERTFTCACGATKVEVEPKVAHTYASEVTQNPTATAYGIYTHSCDCGDSYHDAIAKLGTVYFVPGPWAKGEERYAVYYWNNTSNGWADLTDADGDGVYEAKLDPAAAPNVIFVRMNGGTTENNWDNKWDQTNDLKLPTDGTNLYTISQWGDETSWKGVGTWTTQVMPVLSYTGTFEGVVKLNPETGLYELPLSFNVWNRVAFTYNGRLLTTENTTWTGLFDTVNPNASWTEVLYTEDKSLWLCSRSAGANYFFTYNPETNTVNAVIGGLVWEGTWPGIAEMENGVYVITKTFSQWNRVSLVYNGVQLKLDDITVTGALSAEGATSKPMLYHEDGLFLYAGSTKVTFKLTYDPLTKTLHIEEVQLPSNQLRIKTTNADAGADAVAVWTEGYLRDASGAWKGNGWRLFVVVDAEGKIAYMCHMPPNGYGSPKEGSYYSHSSLRETNPAWEITDSGYTVMVPEGGFALTAHGAGIDAILDILGLPNDAGAINKAAVLSDEVRISYNSAEGIVTFNVPAE